MIIDGKQCVTNSNWISYPQETYPNDARPAAHLRGGFVARASVEVAELEFTACGLAEAWLNGQRICDDYFTPGWSDLRKRTHVCRYDVTDHINAGHNCLGFVLADGWAGAPFGPKGHAVALAPKTMLVAALRLRYADGSEEIFSTGNGWHWRLGAVRSQSLYHGEVYDARKELADWSVVGASNRGWRAAELVPAPEIELSPKLCEPVRVTETVAPVKIWKDAKGGWYADFGQNLVGVVSLKIRKAVSGQKITLRHAEMLEADGSLYVENLRSAKATDVYIAGAEGTAVYSPRWTFHGFRYVHIEGLSTSLRSEDLEALVLHNDLQPTGAFSCSSPMVNALQSCIRWGQRSNFIEAPTDCPQRDERLGWACDAQVFAPSACFNYECEGFYRQWMQAMRDGQRADGAFPDIAPNLLGWNGDAGWADGGVIVPYVVWLHSGSTAILEENWQAMEAYLEFLQKRAKDFIQPKTVFGDWLAMDAVKPQWAPTPKDMIGTAYFAYDAQLMVRMGMALGKTKAAASYSKLASRITAAFQKRFITSEGLVLGDTQTSYLLALGFDLVPEKLIPAASERLVQTLEDRNWHLSTGFLGTPLLNPVLTKIGRTDIAYRLLLEESYPSWLYPIVNGATTMWERWNSWTKEDGFGPVEMNSFNHYAYGAIGEWLYQSLAGIAPDPEKPGYARAVLAASPGEGITWAKAALQTSNGRFESSWKIVRQRFVWKVTIPEGAEALVKVPTAKWQDVRIDGKAARPSLRHSKAKGATRPTAHDRCELMLSAGKYEITCPLAI